eukprot:TRINITY_DN1147_c1_g4_i2.p1 TRINITY_DN1147_c1_g4~~TRINITY_DN1147_c1_g4_i2.p1  ORF type:complete len:291 (-),score=76.96 TRINITY_DN1147_c1_g4_i2:83-910(-)
MGAYDLYSASQGKLWPLRWFGSSSTIFLSTDQLMVVSVTFFLLFLCPYMSNRLSFPIYRGIAVGTIAFVVICKRNQLEGCKSAVSWLSLYFLFHSIGDIIIGPDAGPKEMGMSSIAFGLGWVTFSSIVWRRIPSEKKNWSSLSWVKRILIIALFAWGFTIVIFLLSTMDYSNKQNLWGLVTVPYVICIVSFLACNLLAGAPWLITGNLVYMSSDSMIVVGGLLKKDFGPAIWVSYYLAQWILLIGGLKWIQTQYHISLDEKPINEGAPLIKETRE